MYQLYTSKISLDIPRKRAYARSYVYERRDIERCRSFYRLPYFLYLFTKDEQASRSFLINIFQHT